MQLRLLEPKPRKVLVSKELVIPDNAKAGYEYFKTVADKSVPLWKGENINVNVCNKYVREQNV
jgi:hypothetical protein